MTDSNQLALSARADHAAEVAQALGLAPEAWGVVLLTLMERTETAFAIKDTDTGRYVHANARMNALIGRNAIGLADDEWLPADAVAPLRAADQSAMVQTVPQVSEHRLDVSDARREFSVTRLPLVPADGSTPHHMAVLWLDLTQSRQQESQLQRALAQLEMQQQAADAQRRESQDQIRDKATGLYQEGPFDDQLRREVDLSSREHREFAMVSVALDPPSAKAVSLGQEAQLRVLAALGRLLRSNTRAMDASCRLSEDRFVILLSGVGLATAHSRMEGLRRQCATQIVMLDGEELGFTVSMGVASFPHTAHSQEDLRSAADAALQEAQRRGGNHVTLASIKFQDK